LHFNRIVSFQIGIFIYSDIYCSQAFRSYPWRVLCKNQVNWTGSCATVRTGLWRRPNGPQCPTDKHWRRPDVRAIPSERSVNQYSTRSLLSEIDIVWEVSVFCPDDSASRSDDVHYLQAVWTTRQHVRTIYSNSDNSRIMFERRKDFSEDRPDARSSRPEAHLIRIRYARFLKDIPETCPDGANFRPDSRQTELVFQQFSRSLEAYK
jgi:hypothetical protein